MVDINKEVKFMNFYKCYSGKVDQDQRQSPDEKLLERFNHFEFISKIIYDENFTSVKQDTGYIYYAKSERGVEYQEVIREGIVDLSKFQI
jgi:nickel-dependent lactate racemase